MVKSLILMFTIKVKSYEPRSITLLSSNAWYVEARRATRLDHPAAHVFTFNEHYQQFSSLAPIG